MKLSRKWLLKILIIILLFFAVSAFIFKIIVDPEFSKRIESLGMLGPVVIGLFIILSHVFAPIIGTPIVVVCGSLYGVPRTMLITFISSIISSVINFYISRRFGRNIVTRLVGERAMESVDRIVNNVGVYMLVFSRLFGFSFFELVSYAAGLTKMKFGLYFSITLVCTAIPFIFVGYMFERLKMTLIEQALLFFLINVIVGFLFSLFSRYLYGNKKGVEE